MVPLAVVKSSATAGELTRLLILSPLRAPLCVPLVVVVATKCQCGAVQMRCSVTSMSLLRLLPYQPLSHPKSTTVQGVQAPRSCPNPGSLRSETSSRGLQIRRRQYHLPSQIADLRPTRTVGTPPKSCQTQFPHQACHHRYRRGGPCRGDSTAPVSNLLIGHQESLWPQPPRCQPTRFTFYSLSLPTSSTRSLTESIEPSFIPPFSPLHRIVQQPRRPSLCYPMHLFLSLSLFPARLRAVPLSHLILHSLRYTSRTCALLNLQPPCSLPSMIPPVSPFVSMYCVFSNAIMPIQVQRSMFLHAM